MMSIYQCYRRFIFVLLFFALTSTVHAADVVLSWDDPDNDPSVIAGYNLYYWESGAPSTKVDVALQTSYTVRGLTDGLTYSFAVTAYDERGDESSQSAVISETIGASNNTTPVANNGTLTVAENAVASGTLTGSDADGDALTFQVATAPRLGVVTITDSTNGTFTYNPIGSPTVELSISSVRASTDTDVAPTTNTLDNNLATRWSASGDGQWIEYDLGSIQTVAGMAIAWYKGDQRLAFFDIGVSNDGVNWTTVYNGQSSGTTLQPEMISFSPVEARYVRYVGHQNSVSAWNSLTEVDIYTYGSATGGTDAFTFTVHDGKAQSSEAAITVTITSVNDAPVAKNGTLTVVEDSMGSGKLSGSDADGDPLTYRLTSTGNLGTAILTDASSGAYTYTPNPNMAGTDVFTFTVDDGKKVSSSATVTVTIAPVNDAPVAANGSLSTSEDTPASGKLSASDVDGDALTYSLTSTGSKGTASLTNASTGAFTYTPNANTTGTDSFTFIARDGTASSNPATVTVTINATNDNPVAASDAAQTNEDKGVSIAVLANDKDADGDTLTVASVTQASNGVVAKSGSGITYTPKPDFHGSDSFAYTVSDGKGGTAAASVTVTVASVNDAPVANNAILITSEGRKVSGTLSASDIDGDALTYRLLNTGSLGTAVLDDASSGAFTYTPNDNANGTDTVTFSASDSTATSNTATVTVTIKAVSDTIVMEVGEVSVDDAWTPVALNKNFTDPVVIAKPMGHNDSDPAVVRIRNVTPTGFEIRLQEWEYLDGAHVAENVGFIVVERGFYTLPDGTQVEADYIETSATSTFESIAFQQPFEIVPVVLAVVASVNEADAVTTRVRSVTTQGFEAQMQEQELNTQAHAAERMAYLAWTPSSGTLEGLAFEVARTSDVVTDAFYTIQYATTFVNLPVFIGDMQTRNGSDTASLRWENKDFFGIDIRVAEEQSSDSEMAHAAEAVGYIVLASNEVNQLADTDGDGLSDVQELETYGTDPAAPDTDLDGSPDGAEVAFWNTHPSAWDGDDDGDGLPNLLDLDSDDDGLLDGEEIKQGFDPADPFSPNGPASIALSANAQRIKKQKIIDLTWSGATGGKVEVFRKRNGSQLGSLIITNGGAYTDSVRKSGSYIYQICETDGSVCSSEVTATL